MILWLALTVVGLFEHWPAWLDCLFAREQKRRFWLGGVANSPPQLLTDSGQRHA